MTPFNFPTTVIHFQNAVLQAAARHYASKSELKARRKEMSMAKMPWSGMEDSTPASSTTTNPLDQPDDSMSDFSDIGGKGGWRGMEDSAPCSSAGNGSESGMTGGTRVCDK